jgi:hypothetical protein
MSSRRQHTFLRLAALVVMTVVFAAANSDGSSKRLKDIRALEYASESSACDTPSAYVIALLDTAVVSSDSVFGVGMREQLQLPAGPVSSVTAVTDSIICHRAAVASGLARKTPDSMAVASVAVVRVGSTRYVVFDTTSTAGEFNTGLTFDTTFTVPPLTIWTY